MILINASSRRDAGLFQPFLPIYIPIGVGYLLAACEREGVIVHFVDQQVESDVLARVREFVPGMKPPYIFGISVLTAGFETSLELARAFKVRYPDCIVIFGGIHATAVPEECLAHAQVDLVVCGEAEDVLPELYRRLKNGGDWRSLDGVAYRGPSGVVCNPRRYVMDLDRLPAFPYHRFDKDKYDLGAVMSSRGCPYECIFCSNQAATGKRYRFRSTALVLDEIGVLVERYGVRDIGFLDDNFLVHKERARALARGIKERGWHRDVEFTLQARGDNVDEGILREVFEAGFHRIGFGVETASERVMARIKKGETLQQILAAIKLAHAIGFEVSSTIMFGLPGETREDRAAAMRLAKELDLGLIKFNNAIPYPGTEFYHIAAAEGRLRIDGLYRNFNSVGTFVSVPWQVRPLPYVPEGSTDSDVRDDILWAFWHTFATPRKIVQVFQGSGRQADWFMTGRNVWEQALKLPALVFMGIFMTVKYAGLFIRTGVCHMTRRVSVK